MSGPPSTRCATALLRRLLPPRRLPPAPLSKAARRIGGPRRTAPLVPLSEGPLLVRVRVRVKVKVRLR